MVCFTTHDGDLPLLLQDVQHHGNQEHRQYQARDVDCRPQCQDRESTPHVVPSFPVTKSCSVLCYPVSSLVRKCDARLSLKHATRQLFADGAVSHLQQFMLGNTTVS